MSSAPSIIRKITWLSPDWRVCFETRVGGRTYIQAWGAYLGPAGDGEDDRHLFRFWQQVDPKRIGVNAPRLRQVADLVATGDLAPLRYEMTADGGTASIRIEGEKVSAKLANGSTMTASTKGADYLLAGNMPPQLALIALRLQATGGLPYRGGLLSPESLQVIPYSLVATGRNLKSSLDETLALDDEGMLAEMRTADPDAMVVRVERALPRWRMGQPSIRRRTYAGPPKRLAVEVLDLQVPGPVVPLGASLAVPTEIPAVAAALFLSGSGGHDRHGIAGGYDTGSHQILDRAAARGIVSLRFDKRGHGGTELGKDALDFGFDTVVADGSAALAELAARLEVRDLPLFLIGHSEGGLVALDLAARHDEIAGVVLLATAGRPIDLVMADQAKLRTDEVGLSEESLNVRRAEIAEFFRCVREVPEWTEETVPPKVLAQRNAQRWYVELLRRDPLDLARKAVCPVLIMQGERDAQISVADAELLREAAEAGGADVTSAVLPGLDHFFKRAVAGDRLASLRDRRRTVSTRMIDRLASWIASVAT